MPGRTARDALAGQRRGEVLDAAEPLLAAHGYDALRLRDVSRAAGVSIGLIQHYLRGRVLVRAAARLRAAAAGGVLQS